MNHKRLIDETLLLQYLLGNATGEEIRAVEAWLAADAAHRKELDRLEALWLETGRLEPAPVAVDVDKAWKRMTERMEASAEVQPDMQGETRNIRKDGGFRKWWFAAAAVALLLAGMYFLWLTVVPEKDVLLVSTEDSCRTDTLADGSVVTLNSRSRLSGKEGFNRTGREVTLRGEALFKVTPDPAKPFIVHAGFAGIRVLGTIFSVRESEMDVTVTVTEGKVLFFRIDPGTGDTVSIQLLQGESVTWQKRDNLPGPKRKPAPDVHFWAGIALDFRDMPLSEIIPVIEKRFQVTVRVTDPSILACRLTAQFEGEPADHILAVIAESFSLRLEQHGNTFTLSGEGCP